MKRKVKFIASIVLILIITLTSTVFATSDIEDAKDELEGIQSDIEQSEKEKESLENEKDNTLEQIEQLDTEIASLTQDIEQIKSDLDEKEKQYDEIVEELDQAKIDEEAQYEQAKKRIKYMYENGNTGYLDVIFSAESFSDMLNKMEFVGRIIDYDKNVFISLQETKDLIAEKEQQVEQEKIEMEEMSEELDSQNASLQVAKDKKDSEVAALQKDIENVEEKLKELEQAENETNNLLKKLEEERKQQEASGGGSDYVGGVFTWPVPGYTTISSPYGYRYHPISGIYKLHTGIDVPAPAGVPVLAAADGTVISARYNGGWGNEVLIDHGGGIVTQYAHNSSMSVSVGQTVTKGQEVAKIGTTGTSTGNHLHFGVSKNGSWVDPTPYLTGN